MTDEELTELRNAAVESMQSVCLIGVLETSRGSAGAVKESFVYDEDDRVPCGVEMLTGQAQREEFRTADGTVVQAEVRLRLPHGTVIDETSKVRLLVAYGEDLTAVDYDVLGTPAVGVTAVTAYLRAVSH